MTDKTVKTITLRRDGKGPLKFSGERMGSATRRFSHSKGDGTYTFYEISARLFRTTGGKYVAGIEVYNRSDEEYVRRSGWIAEVVNDQRFTEEANRASMLHNLLDEIRDDKTVKPYVDSDLLAELFEDTEIGAELVENVD